VSLANKDNQDLMVLDPFDRVNMTQKKEMSKIFLSYTRADRDDGQKLGRLLSQQRPNLRIFTTDTLSAGEDWRSRLKDELTQCDLFIVILSPNSIDSDWVLQELGAAWAIDKPIIPVVTQPGLLTRIPVDLKDVQVVELKDIEKPEVINQILERYEAAVTSTDVN